MERRSKGFALWFTGLPCSGKTTISDLIEKELRAAGNLIEHLDGDLIRKNLSIELGFSKKDRMTNIERTVFVADLLARNGVGTIVSFISPYREMRAAARQKIKNYIEVYVRCPLEVCERRDVKGMYKLARQGKIPNFTGVSDPYEEPVNPEIVVDTDRMDIRTCVEKIMVYLESGGFLGVKNPFPKDGLLSRAFELANHHHRGQERKGGLPYITHPVSVAKALHEAGCSTEIVAAGLLHDVFEDTGCEYEEMKDAVGPRVTGWVGQLTETNKTVSWKKRKAQYLKKIQSAPKQVLAVVCADKSDNIRCLTEGLEALGKRFGAQFSGKMKDKIKNYEKIYELIRSRYRACPLLDSYDSRLKDLKRLIDRS